MLESIQFYMSLSATTRNELLSERKNIIREIAQLEVLKQKLQAIDILLQQPINMNGNGTVEMTMPLFTEQKSSDSYDKNWIWADKCLFAIGKLGKAYTADVVKEIFRYEPDLKSSEKEERKNEAKTNYTMSQLYRAGKIKLINKSGRKHQYVIP